MRPNIKPISVTLLTFQLLISWSKTVSYNIPFIFLTLPTSHEDISPLKLFAPRNISSIFVTLLTSHKDKSLLNELAWRNISSIIVTLLTSQFEISPLKLVILNILLILVTSETTYPDRTFASSTQVSPETKLLKISSDIIVYSLPLITPTSPEIPQSWAFIVTPLSSR